jgi:hypothetical protein
VRVGAGPDRGDLGVADESSGRNRGDADACCEQRNTADGPEWPPSKLWTWANAVDEKTSFLSITAGRGTTLTPVGEEVLGAVVAPCFELLLPELLP